MEFHEPLYAPTHFRFHLWLSVDSWMLIPAPKNTSPFPARRDNDSGPMPPNIGKGGEEGGMLKLGEVVPGYFAAGMIGNQG